MDVTEKEVKAEFNSLGIQINENLLPLCALICKRNGVTPNDLVETWIAFTFNNHSGEMILTEENILLMETKDLASSKSFNNSYKSNIPDISNDAYINPLNQPKPVENNTSFENEFMEVTPSKVDPKKKLSSVQNNYCFPPKIIHTYGFEEKNYLEDENINIVQNVMPDVGKDSCMYSTIKEEASILSDTTFQIIETIKNNHKLSEEEHGDNGYYYSGKIIQSPNSKLNPASIHLHNPDLGDFIVDVSQIHEFSLFPGQVIIVKGVRSGNKIIASNIYDNGRLPLSDEKISITGKIKLLVASGPFIESETDDFESLEYLAKCVKSLKVQIIIILGPIINSKSFSSCDSFDFKSLYKKALEHLSSLIDKNIKIYCVINKLDRCSIPSYPTLPPSLVTFGNVFLLADPAVISVNGVSIGLSSSDTLVHIAKHEIRKNCSERFLQLCDHCIKQQTMYPLYPADISVGIDIKLWHRYGLFNHSPHFLFFRSVFKYFVKESEEKHVMINTGSLSSKKDTKTFALLELLKSDINDWDPTKSSCVKILKA